MIFNVGQDDEDNYAVDQTFGEASGHVRAFGDITTDFKSFFGLAFFVFKPFLKSRNLPWQSHSELCALIFNFYLKKVVSLKQL